MRLVLCAILIVGFAACGDSPLPLLVLLTEGSAVNILVVILVREIRVRWGAPQIILWRGFMRRPVLYSRMRFFVWAVHIVNRDPVTVTLQKAGSFFQVFVTWGFQYDVQPSRRSFRKGLV